MIRRGKRDQQRKREAERFLRASNRAWILDPALSETEESVECVRVKRRRDAADAHMGADPDELSDEFED
ncbi:MAG: hypothetical protein EBZ48_10600 [Proteobacteria bacterium]|nr:hypothetical protein [Pseudomonadota bacterium]